MTTTDEPAIEGFEGLGGRQSHVAMTHRDAMKFTVLTYNTHLCGLSGMGFFGAGGRLCGYPKTNHAAPRPPSGGAVPRPITYQDHVRMMLICEQIKELDPDVVILQEIWDHYAWSGDVVATLVDGNLVAGVAHELLPHYGHFFWPPDLNLEYAWSNIPRFWRAGARALGLGKPVNAFAVGSGLLLFSKYPIVEQSFKAFTPTAHDDKMALKGVAACTLLTPEGRLRISGAHAGTDCGGPTLQHIRDVVQHTIDDAHDDLPAIMAGDYNVFWGEQSDQMLRIFADVGARDAFADTHRDATWQAYTDQFAQIVQQYQDLLEELDEQYRPLNHPEGGGDVLWSGLPGKAVNGPWWWHLEPRHCPTSIDTEGIMSFRKELAELTARFGITANDPANLMFAYFAEKPSIGYLHNADMHMRNAPTRLDYVVYRNAVTGGLKPVDVSVLTNFVFEQPRGGKYLHRETMGRPDDPDLIDLSDHRPVLATFEWSA